MGTKNTFQVYEVPQLWLIDNHELKFRYKLTFGSQTQSGISPWLLLFNPVNWKIRIMSFPGKKPLSLSSSHWPWWLVEILCWSVRNPSVISRPSEWPLTSTTEFHGVTNGSFKILIDHRDGSYSPRWLERRGRLGCINL